MRTGAVAAVSASKIYELVKDKDIPNIEIIKESEKFWI